MYYYTEEKYGITFNALDFYILFGADAVFAFKFGGGMSLMAGLDVGTNVAGYGLYWLTGDSVVDSDGDTFTYGLNGFVVKPRIGISWGL